MYTKAGEKEFLKSYIGLLSCHLTNGVSSELAFLQMNVYGLQMKFILYNKTVYLNFLLHEEFDIAHKITM